MELQITDRAQTRLKEVARQENIDIDQTFLRVAVVPGGCSGLSYELGWDTMAQETDDSTIVAGLHIVVDPRSAVYLEGIELDFSDGFEGKGFQFINPQATRTCACGESFSL